MINFNYYTKYKKREAAVTSSMDYFLKLNKLSNDLELENSLSNTDISRLDKSKSSCWIIHSKKTKQVSNYKGKNWSVYLCVFSFMQNNGIPFSKEINVPSFVLHNFDLIDKDNNKIIGKLKILK